MILILIQFIIVLILYQLYRLLTKNFDYWKQKNVPYPKPRPLFGNYMDYILQKKNAPTITSEICQQFPDEPYVGVFYGPNPTLIVKDPNIIKLVMAQDFYYFSGREVTDYAHKETMTENLFFNGGDEWKVLRQNLSQFFTSARLKNMFPLINDCAKELEIFLKEETVMSQSINIKKIFARYSMECIINCAFGIRANTMKRDTGTNAFVFVAESIFDSSITRGMRMICRAIWPSLFYGLRFKMFEEKIISFFIDIFMKSCKSRCERGTSRNDFIHLVSNWKDEKYITGDSLSNIKTGAKKIERMEVTDELLASQCMLFFAAGFETTSSAITFILYELAKNKHAQDRVIEEVEAYFEKYSGNIEYECINELSYIEACMEEALRLYPALGTITREVMDDYTLPTGVCLKKGDRVHIPVQYLHRRPEYFPDPDSFRPERFIGEEKKKIKQYTFFPFGEGPRLCIGIRLGRMVVYAALLTLFKNYRFELAENMPHSVELKSTSLVIQSKMDVYLKFIPRSK